MRKNKPTPNITYVGGCWPGRKVFWASGTHCTMRIRLGWQYGRYVRTSETEATWEFE